LKNNTSHRISKPWIEKTSIEEVKNSVFGKIGDAMIAMKKWLSPEPIKIFVDKY
jgi:hypothetical protein